MNVAFEVTLGVGDGGLLNFERAALEQVLLAGETLREGREQGSRVSERQRLLEELRAVYQRTVDAWGKSGRARNDQLEERLTATHKQAETAQIEALESFFNRQHLPLKRLKSAARHGASIRRAGSLKTAAAVLE